MGSYQRLQRVNSFAGLATAVVLFVSLLSPLALVASGDEQRCEEQAARAERLAVARLLAANMMRRQRAIWGVPEPIARTGYVAEEAHVPAKGPGYERYYPPVAIAAPAGSRMTVSVREETVANPDRGAFWATQTQTVYTLRDENGVESQVVHEWR